MSKVILAIDTSTPRLSVALQGGDGRVYTDVSKSLLSHNEEIVQSCSGILESAGLTTANISTVLIGAGPGSFTGLRIGYSFVAGLCSSLHACAYSLSSFYAAALCINSTHSDRDIRVLAKANRNEIFSALYPLKLPRAEWQAVIPELIPIEEVQSSTSDNSGPLSVVLGEDLFDLLSAPNEINGAIVSVDNIATGLLSAFQDASFAASKRESFSALDLSEMRPDYVQPVAAKTIRERQRHE